MGQSRTTHLQSGNTNAARPLHQYPRARQRPGLAPHKRIPRRQRRARQGRGLGKAHVCGHGHETAVVEDAAAAQRAGEDRAQARVDVLGAGRHVGVGAARDHVRDDFGAGLGPGHGAAGGEDGAGAVGGGDGVGGCGEGRVVGEFGLGWWLVLEEEECFVRL